MNRIKQVTSKKQSASSKKDSTSSKKESTSSKKETTSSKKETTSSKKETSIIKTTSTSTTYYYLPTTTYISVVESYTPLEVYLNFMLYTQPIGFEIFYNSQMTTFRTCRYMNGISICERSVALPATFTVESHRVYYGVNFDQCSAN